MFPLVKKMLIADDHPLIRRGLRMLICNELKLPDITEVDDFEHLIKELDRGIYSHLILDLILSDINSAEKFAYLRKKYPGVAIAIYSMHPKEIYAPHLLRLGARCYINKKSSDEEMVNCLKVFFTGGKCYKSENVPLEQNESLPVNPFASLSQRELEVFQHLIQGLSIKEIAALLKLRSNTIATFKQRIFGKLEVKNVLELSQLASMYHIGLS